MADGNPWRQLVAALREVCAGATGDYAYEAWRRHRARCHPDCPTPSRAEYEKHVAARRYDGVSRCC